MAYGLAEGLRKSAGKIAPKGKKGTTITGTFGSHFKMEEAVTEMRKEGFAYEVEKGHTLRVHLGESTQESAERVRAIIRDHYGYVEPV